MNITTNKDQVPLVSICCITYNHAPFIKQCLDGFLMQKTTFPIEILIHDDASTDGTDDIIREYASAYPGVIFPLFEVENQYSKPGHKHMDLYNYERAKGKYIAYCEGDDYWTDPLKLQRQVNFLEAHEDYSVCWHRYQRFYWQENTWKEDDCGKVLRPNEDGVEIDIATYLSGWYTQPLTMVFRKSCFDFQWNNKYKFYRDEHEQYHLLTVGRGYLFGYIGGVYVIHGGGVYGAQNTQIQSRTSCAVAEELYQNNKNDLTKGFYEKALQWAIYQHRTDFPRKFFYSWRQFALSWKLKLFLKNLWR